MHLRLHFWRSWFQRRMLSLNTGEDTGGQPMTPKVQQVSPNRVSHLMFLHSVTPQNSMNSISFSKLHSQKTTHFSVTILQQCCLHVKPCMPFMSPKEVYYMHLRSCAQQGLRCCGPVSSQVTGTGGCQLQTGCCAGCFGRRSFGYLVPCWWLRCFRAGYWRTLHHHLQHPSPLVFLPLQAPCHLHRCWSRVTAYSKYSGQYMHTHPNDVPGKMRIYLH